MTFWEIKAFSTTPKRLNFCRGVNSNQGTKRLTLAPRPSGALTETWARPAPAETYRRPPGWKRCAWLWPWHGNRPSAAGHSSWASIFGLIQVEQGRACHSHRQPAWVSSVFFSFFFGWGVGRAGKGKNGQVLCVRKRRGLSAFPLRPGPPAPLEGESRWARFGFVDSSPGCCEVFGSRWGHPVTSFFCFSVSVFCGFCFLWFLFFVVSASLLGMYPFSPGWGKGSRVLRRPHGDLSAISSFSSAQCGWAQPMLADPSAS